MKRLIYQVRVGNESNSKLYDWCCESVRNYCKKNKIDYYCQKEAILKIAPDLAVIDNPDIKSRSRESFTKHGGFLPIYEKENAFAFFEAYDQIAIIDADIYIRETAPNIFDEVGTDVDFAGVIEREMPINNIYKNKILNYSAGQYGHEHYRDRFTWKQNVGADFYNMGMMVLNKSITKYLHGMTPHQFITQPRFKHFVDGLGTWKWSTDQTLLNIWVKEEQMRVKNLSYKWNALFTAVEEDKIPDAHFIHFFLKDKLPNRGENVEQLKKQIGV